MPSPPTPPPPSSKPAAAAPTGATSTCPAPPCPPPDKWLADALKVMCPKDAAFLYDLRARGVTITQYDRIFYKDPIYDGTKWTTKHFEGGGSTSGTHMNIVTMHGDGKGGRVNSSPEDTASTIYHEGVHTGQPNSMSWQEKEYDAYTKGEQWHIDHGLPPSGTDFRTTDGTGKAVPNTPEIKKFVDKEYPISTEAPAKAGAKPDVVVNRDAKGNTVLEREDGTQYSRPPKKGDTYPGPEQTEPPGGRPAKSCQLKCC